VKVEENVEVPVGNGSERRWWELGLGIRNGTGK
jgi:hypothetical protein